MADQELAEAQWRLEKTYIRSPFCGVITGRSVQPGQHIRPGDELFVVADFDPLVARIYMPEKDVLELSEGRMVRLALRADEKIRFDGKIRQISPVVDTATGTVKVTVEVVGAPKEVGPAPSSGSTSSRTPRKAPSWCPAKRWSASCRTPSCSSPRTASPTRSR